VDEIIKCTYCQKPAVYHRKISNEYVCPDHFVKTIERKILRTVRKYKMFSPMDKLAVGVSGGKDSLAVLYNVIQIQRSRQSSTEIHAILIDEGIHGYREESVEIAKKFCKKWQIPLHILRFQEHFGLSLDQCIPNLQNLLINACTVCGTVRRRLLNDKAREIGAKYLVIGHNLDDQAETFLQNIIRNDLSRIFLHPPWGNLQVESGIFIPRVKPLMEIPESEITLYCYFKKFPIQTTPCPYVEPYFILRKQVQTFLNHLEHQSAEVKYNLLRMHENILKLNKPIENSSKDLSELKSYQLIKERVKSEITQFCSNCHEPSGNSRDLCYYCFLKSKLGLI